jgi:hypothetical protein
MCFSVCQNDHGIHTQWLITAVVFATKKKSTAVFGNLAKISTPIFAHARKFPFNLNVNFHACAKIVVEIFARFPKTAVIRCTGHIKGLGMHSIPFPFYL